MTNASILSILAHATPTPTSRSKGQKSKSRGGAILWRPPSRTACLDLSTHQNYLVVLSLILCLINYHLCISTITYCQVAVCQPVINYDWLIEGIAFLLWCWARRVCVSWVSCNTAADWITWLLSAKISSSSPINTLTGKQWKSCSDCGLEAWDFSTGAIAS